MKSDMILFVLLALGGDDDMAGQARCGMHTDNALVISIVFYDSVNMTVTMCGRNAYPMFACSISTSQVTVLRRLSLASTRCNVVDAMLSG